MPLNGMGRRARSLFALKSMGMSLLGQGSSGQCRPGLAEGPDRACAVRRGTYDRPSCQVIGTTWEVQP